MKQDNVDKNTATWSNSLPDLRINIEDMLLTFQQNLLCTESNTLWLPPNALACEIRVMIYVSIYR
jgi:hypothetical protein